MDPVYVSDGFDEEAPKVLARTSKLVPKFLGLTLPEAKELARRRRLVLRSVDMSVASMLHMDFVPNRVTVYFVNGFDGVVVRAEPEE